MRIEILQHDITWANPAKNLEHLEAMIGQHPGADLYVLTEMFSTGFATEPEGIAETEGGETLRWMRRKAQAFDAAIAGSIATEKDGRYYNRFYFVKPDGTVTYYDKRHLFTYGGEDRHFTHGEERVVVEFRGVRFLPLVCYDLRFPVWSRNRDDYDAMLYVANWPASRMEAWSTLLRARAIENQCYVAGVNRVGSDPSCEYCGGSAIISPYGKTLAACEDNVECTATAELNMQKLEAFRQKFPVLNDADNYSLQKYFTFRALVRHR